MIGLLFLFAQVLVAPCWGAAAGGRRAYVTLLSGDDYAWGARVLGQSLSDVTATAEKLCLVTPHVSKMVVRKKKQKKKKSSHVCQ